MKVNRPSLISGVDSDFGDLVVVDQGKIPPSGSTAARGTIEWMYRKGIPLEFEVN
jgi:hypothetical protein